jgi:hypothetical protein
MVMVGGRGKSYETLIPWIAPMAVMRRAFSALVKAAFWAFGKQYFVLLCETLVLFVVNIFWQKVCI